LRASVGHTSARIAIPPNCVGHIDQRKLLRRVGPEQIAHSTFVTSVEATEERIDNRWGLCSH
jgi:hypothetical protein